MVKNAFAVLAVFAFLMAAGCATQNQHGALEGTVTIGPLCPVEPCHLTPEQTAAAYTSRNLTVYATDRKTVVRQMPLPGDGRYAVELDAGTYYVTVKPAGIGELEPTQVNITANGTTKLDIQVDTGIR